VKPADFDGFMVNVLLDEDGSWVAHSVELPHISAFADSPDEAVAELQQAWSLTKESYLAAGEAVPVTPANKNLRLLIRITVVSSVCVLTSVSTVRLPWRRPRRVLASTHW
jgi:predicted RNase H-like HicB family nuclease